MKEWLPPSECDQCEHAIAEHIIFTPEPHHYGYMYCGAPNCEKCWHEWPQLGPADGTDRVQIAWCRS